VTAPVLSGSARPATPRRRRTLRARLTAWYAIALGLGLTLVAGASLVTLQLVLEDRADRYLRAAWRAFTTELLVEAAEFADADRAIAETRREVRFEDTHFEVTPASDPASPSGGTPPPDDRPDAPATVALTLTTRDAPAGDDRRAEGRVRFHGRAWSVVAVHPLAPLRDTVRSVALAYAVTLPLVLAVSLVGGYATARRALAPVADMGRRARAIEATTLHDRLPVEDPDDELGELADVINGLLARLEAAFAQQRRLVADASHELRTPVAVLMAEADVLLAREGRPEAEYRERIGVLRDATARLARLVEDLFLLSRADSGHLVPRREPLYLAEVAADAVRAMQSIASRRDVRLVLDVAPPPSEGAEGAPMVGDPALLDRLFLNLLDNAIKHAPPGTTVHVTLAHEARHRATDGTLPEDRYVLRVSDAGAGIPVEAQPLIFDRFYRVDQARTRSHAAGGPLDGAGLGLAIARWVADVHEGRLDLEQSSPSGTTFRWLIPTGTERAGRPRAGSASGS
jgi:signal transduction histidine kinase